MAWKYQAWLAGYNGGPMRMPTNRRAGSPAGIKVVTHGGRRCSRGRSARDTTHQRRAGTGTATARPVRVAPAAGAAPERGSVSSQLGHKYADELYGIHIGSGLLLDFLTGPRAC